MLVHFILDSRYKTFGIKKVADKFASLEPTLNTPRTMLEMEGYPDTLSLEVIKIYTCVDSLITWKGEGNYSTIQINPDAKNYYNSETSGELQDKMRITLIKNTEIQNHKRKEF